MPSARANTGTTSARRGSASLTGPGAEQEFFRARHGDVQQATFSPRSASGRGTMPSSIPAIIVARTVSPLEPIIVMMRTPRLSAMARSFPNGVICGRKRPKLKPSSTSSSSACSNMHAARERHHRPSSSVSCGAGCAVSQAVTACISVRTRQFPLLPPNPT